MAHAHKADVVLQTPVEIETRADARAVSAKVISMATRAPYQEPSVTVLPIDGMALSGTLTTAGNVGNIY